MFIQLYFKIVVLRVDLVGQLGLLDDVSHKFELVKEEQKLPDQPDHDKQERAYAEGHHGGTVGQLYFGSRLHFVYKGHHGDLKADVGQLN